MRRFPFLSVLVVAPVAVGAWAMQPKPVLPVGSSQSGEARRRSADAIRVMTFNLAHGRKLSLHQAFLRRATIRKNLSGISSLIRLHAPDLVAAQELDGRSMWSGRFDHAATLANHTGLENVFRGSHGGGFGPLVLDYGTGLLSRHPLFEPTSTAFNTSWRDNKGFVVATITPPEFGGLEIDIVSVHLDFVSRSVRAEQLEQLAGVLEQRGRPLVVMGDFNCTLEELECLPRFMERVGLRPHRDSVGQPTFPADGARSQIDWILISDELEFRSYKTLPDRLSDHLAVMADVALRSGGVEAGLVAMPPPLP